MDVLQIAPSQGHPGIQFQRPRQSRDRLGNQALLETDRETNEAQRQREDALNTIKRDADAALASV